MRFFLISDAVGETLACTSGLQAAHGWARVSLDSTTSYSITAIDVPVTAETVRRLLGDEGGYALRSRDLGTFNIKEA